MCQRFGRGEFMSLDAWIADSWLGRFTELINGLTKNAVVMLSNYIPAAKDPQQGRYKAFIKYGKLGGEFTFLDNPFKKPVMMFKPGSVFWDDNPRAVYGRTVPDVNIQKKEVVHFGCSVAIPAYFDKQGL